MCTLRSTEGKKYTDYGNFWLFIVWRWEIFFLYSHITVSFLLAAYKFSKSTIFLLAVLYILFFIFFFIKRLNFQTTGWIIPNVRILYNTSTYHKSKSNARSRIADAVRPLMHIKSIFLSAAKKMHTAAVGHNIDRLRYCDGIKINTRDASDIYTTTRICE